MGALPTLWLPPRSPRFPTHIPRPPEGTTMPRRRLVILAAATTLLAGSAVITAGQASAAAGCQVKYTISSQWQGGFGAAVDVTNLGDPINGWSLVFSFSAGQTMTQLWNGSVSQSGSTV